MPEFPEYEDYLAFIETEAAKDAYRYLASASLLLKDYTIRAKPHGYIKHAVHFFKNGYSPFAFKVNRRWLSFDLRYPQRTHPSLVPNQLAVHFSEVKTLTGGRITFRISNVEDAKQTMRLIFGIGSDDVFLPDSAAYSATEIDEEEYVPQTGDWRKVVVRQIRERRGQQQFRDALRKRYGDQCFSDRV